MRKILGIVGMFAVLPYAASAEDNLMAQNYSYFEGGLRRILKQEDVIPANALHLEGSFLTTDNIYVIGNLETYRRKKNEKEASFEEKSSYQSIEFFLGAGYRYPINAKFDITGEGGLGLFNQKYSDSYTSPNDSGSMDVMSTSTFFWANVGLRSLITDNFSVWAKAGFSQTPKIENVSDGDTFFLGKVGAKYEITRNWGVALEYVRYNKVNIMNASVRYTF